MDRRYLTRLMALMMALTLTVSGLGALAETADTIQADQIIRNANIFTADQDNPQATALVVKDGKFVYEVMEALGCKTVADLQKIERLGRCPKGKQTRSADR